MSTIYVSEYAVHHVYPDGHVAGLGFNRGGLLGIGSPAAMAVPVATPLYGQAGVRFTDVVTGGYQGAALAAPVPGAAGGRVLVWGLGTFGARGDGRAADPLEVLGKAPPGAGVPSWIDVDGEGRLFDDAVQLVAGLWFLAALRADGSVWFWGLNDRGQGGDRLPVPASCPIDQTGPSNCYIRQPQRVALPPGVMITKLSTGQDIFLALDSTGGVWAWGWGDYLMSNLGLGPSKLFATSTPTRITGIPPMIDVLCGNEASLFLDASGNLWGCGPNRMWTLSASTGNIVVPHPTRLTKHGFDGRCAKLSTSAYCLYLLLTDGTLWSVGASPHGEAGVGRISPSSVAGRWDGADLQRDATPQMVLSGVADVISCPGTMSAWALMLDGTWRSWGRDKSGQLGDGRVADADQLDHTSDRYDAASPIVVAPW